MTYIVSSGALNSTHSLTPQGPNSKAKGEDSDRSEGKGVPKS